MTLIHARSTIESALYVMSSNIPRVPPAPVRDSGEKFNKLSWVQVKVVVLVACHYCSKATGLQLGRIWLSVAGPSQRDAVTFLHHLTRCELT